MRLGSLCVCAVLLAGCIESRMVPCGDGSVCPSDYRCLPSGGCASSLEDEACVGLAAGDSCFVMAVGFGHCIDGACIKPVCGNHRVEFGELCDDGNALGGDGCDATCTSTEMCGNGKIDAGEVCDCGDGTVPSTCAQPNDANASNPAATCRSDCKLVGCGNGLIDAGEVCDDGNAVGGDGCNAACRSDESCGNGQLDLGEECDCGDGTVPSSCAQPNDANHTNPAATCRSDCKQVLCGNGLIDAGEACDDGNRTPGDGCNQDCSSNETCGNGIFDFFAGEVCDDGNTRNHDGCDKACKVESPSWHVVGKPPSARTWSVAAYDLFRGYVVMFGGGSDTATLFAETWEWTGTAWLQRFPSVSPPARRLHAMAYDSKRHRIVLFGGMTSSGTVLDDTWEWDGATWTQRFPTHVPPALDAHVMAYDAARGRTVMFGQGFSTPNETWEWDGNDWFQLSPATAPPQRLEAALAYDPVRNKTVLYGGYTAADPLCCKDTWEWDGSIWRQRTTTSVPGRLQGHTMVFDPTIGTVVMFGGKMPSTTYGAVYRWNESTSAWVAMSTTAKPDLWHHAAAFDARRGKMVVFGGQTTVCTTSCTNPIVNDTFELETAVTPTAVWNKPSHDATAPRLDTSFAPDSARGNLVLYGGDYNTTLGDTWMWDGAAWKKSQVVFPAAPRELYGHSMADTSDGVILFGGNQGAYDAAAVDDTWRWDGGGWTKLQPVNRPPVCEYCPMARDPGGLVLFGGQVIDTTTWNGSDWQTHTNLSPAPSPSMPSMKLAYDERRQRTVLLGGTSNAQQTWEWNGAAWAQASSSSAVPPGGGMTYDPLRGRVVAWSASVASTVTMNDLWEWDGSTWRSGNAPPLATEALNVAGFAYDARMQQLVIYASDAKVVNSTTTGTASYLIAAQWGRGVTLDESCLSGNDTDGDGKVGCADDECWPVCDPTCPPGAASCPSLATRPHCGGSNPSPLSTHASCPADVPAPAPICGDLVCDATETNASCPADCHLCGDGVCSMGETNADCPADCP